MVWQGTSWHGMARHGRVRQGQYTGSGPLAVACGCERTGDGPGRGRARQGTARRGSAGRGRGSNQALALGGRLHQKEQSGRAAWKPWNRPTTWRKPAVLWTVFQQGEPEKKKADD